MSERRSAEERREALRKRTQRSVNDREKKGLGRKSVLNLNDIEEINFFEPGEKTYYHIDILPFIVTQKWYEDLRIPSGRSTGLKVGYDDYKLEIPVHKSVGPNNDHFLCLNKAFGKKCPICEELRAEYDKDKKDQDETKIRTLKPSWRNFYNIYNYDDPDKDLQIWSDFSYHMFEKLLMEEADLISFSDLEEGKIIKIKFREKKLGDNSFLEAIDISFIDRETSYSDDIFDETVSFDKYLHIPTYEEVLHAFLGLDEESNVDVEVQEKKEPEVVEEPPKKVSKLGRSRQVKPTTPTEEEPVVDSDNKCPGGGRFGFDCNEIDYCTKDCPEETFEECAKELEQIENSSSKEEQEEVVEEQEEVVEEPQKRAPRLARPRKK